MEILFVDDDVEEFQRLFLLPFGQMHKDEISHTQDPVNVAQIAVSNNDLRLIILDILWGAKNDGTAIPLGASVMQKLAETVPEIPVVIYSIIDDEQILNKLIPEMMRLGAYDWVSKDEDIYVRSFKLERAYKAGRTERIIPASRAILPPDQQHRSDVHVAILFIDMSGFTALTHEIGAKNVVQILEAFYKEVGEIVRNLGGYVDKYIGDAVMAIFGASAPKPDDLNTHVQQCIEAARRIQRNANAFRSSNVEPIMRLSNIRKGPDEEHQIGRFRIGIESGYVEVVRFNRGNESEITFIGTPVNIAARILNQGSAGEVWCGQNAVNTGAKYVDVDLSREVEYRNLPGTFKAYLLRV